MKLSLGMLSNLIATTRREIGIMIGMISEFFYLPFLVPLFLVAGSTICMIF